MNDYYNYEKLKANMEDFEIGKEQSFLFVNNRIYFEDFKNDLLKLERENLVKIINAEFDIDTGVISATIKRIK